MQGCEVLEPIVTSAASHIYLLGLIYTHLFNHATYFRIEFVLVGNLVPSDIQRIIFTFPQYC